jgi:hypothetical protein
MKLQLRYPVTATPERFWEVYFDPDVTTRMHLEALGSTSVEVEALTGTPATGVERTLRYAQVPDAPGPVKKLFGAEVVTVEQGSFDPATGIWSFTLTPATMADKTDLRGTIEIVEQAGDDGATFEQVFSLEAKVKIFGAGPVVERFIEKQARDTQDRAATFLASVLDGTA